MDWEEYEKKCDDIREENQRYLEVFAEDLKSFSPKTVRNHLANADFFLNVYLPREDALTMQEGISFVDSFLGYYFIRKCMWSTPATIKTTAASIKKFYKSMTEHGLIKREAYDQLCHVIKENMDLWQADCAAYNDPDADYPFDIW